MLKLSRSIRGIQSSAAQPPPRKTSRPAAPAAAVHPPRIRLKQRPVPTTQRGAVVPTSPAFPSPKESIPKRSPPKPSTSSEESDGFNGALYTLKALGIATAIVATGAAVSVAGVMTWMGVSDISEFSQRVRTWVASAMPVLSAQIHRRLTPSDTHPRHAPSDTATAVHALPPSPSPPEPATATRHPSITFNHDASQDRLAAAYDKGGFYAWLEAAMKEMEAEADVERARTAGSRDLNQEQTSAKTRS